jgi:hypothetical protein
MSSINTSQVFDYLSQKIENQPPQPTSAHPQTFWRNLEKLIRLPQFIQPQVDELEVNTLEFYRKDKDDCFAYHFRIGDYWYTVTFVLIGDQIDNSCVSLGVFDEDEGSYTTIDPFHQIHIDEIITLISLIKSSLSFLPQYILDNKTGSYIS